VPCVFASPFSKPLEGFCAMAKDTTEMTPGHCVTVLGWEDPRGCDENDNSFFVIDQDTGRPLPRDDAAHSRISNSIAPVGCLHFYDV
jgi:hypothetical protein